MLRRLLHTPRLRLVPITPELARAQLEGDEALALRLAATVPPTWPPPLTADTQTFIAERLGAHPEETGWWFWYWLLPDHSEPGRTAIAIGGFKGPPDESGTVEVGYSVLPAYQRCGFATEAVAALLHFAFDDARVTRVVAETLPELVPSIRVLERNGFRRAADPPNEPTALRFERVRTEVREGESAGERNG